MSSLVEKDQKKFECIKVKALVDKEKNRVIFFECDEDFVDVLFGFLTIPMGTIVSLTNNENLPGCINKLYESVENLDVKYFRTQECQQMLLYPRNGALTQCRRLKISVDDDDLDAHTYFYCERSRCMDGLHKIIFFHEQSNCANCGTYMKLFQRKSSGHDDSADPVNAGAFLKGLTRLVITDDLQLMHPPSFSLLSELGVMEATASTALEVREFNLSKDGFLSLLKSSLVLKEALTQTLLKKNEPYEDNLFSGSSGSSFKRIFGLGEAENRKIRVKLFVSKSKKRVCFAEVGEDFVDLVFSFLTIPLGHVLKQIRDGTSIAGCVYNLYKSIDDLDVEYFKSGSEKEVLLNPKIAPKFGYDNQLLIGVEEVSCGVYFDTSTFRIKVEDPKIPTTHKEGKSNGGFMAGPLMFTVTDDLCVIPISAVSGLNILNILDVPFSDIQERVVHVGNKEATCLPVASFGSESALTHTFLQK